MPFMIIYKGGGKKWHKHHCKNLSHVSKEIKIGSIGEPDPPLEEMCPICFDFLFKYYEKHEIKTLSRKNERFNLSK